MKVRLFAVFAVLALLVGIAGVPSAWAQDTGTAKVRVVHASPDAPAVDIYVDGSVPDGLANVPFFTASGYLDLPAGDHEIQIAPAGAPLDQAVIATTVSLTEGNDYTIAAIGLLESLQVKLYEDDLGVIPAGEARVNVYHMSPDAPAVDVKLADGTFLVQDLPFPDDAEFTTAAGTYDIVVTPTGAADPVISLPGTTLEAGVVYDVFATDVVANITPQLVTTTVGNAAGEADEADEEPTEAPAEEEPVATEAPVEQATEEPAPTEAPAPAPQQGTARVSVVHASPDAPAVDVYVDGSVVLEGVTFFTASSYLDVPAGERRFQITPAGSPASDAVIDTTATLNPDQAYTVAATGLVADIQATLLQDNLGPTAPGEARVSVFHFSPDAPAVDVKLADGTVLLSNLAFPGGAEIDVPAGTYDIIVTPAGLGSSQTDENIVISLPGTTLEAGNVYNVYATDVLANITPQLQVVSVGTTGAPAPTAVPTSAPPAPVAPSPTPAVPASLPVTSDGGSSGLPLPMMGIAALLLIGMGGVLLLLRRRISG